MKRIEFLAFVKVTASAKTPTRAHFYDAGIDVYADLKFKTNYITIPPGTGQVISTGLKFIVPRGFMLEVKNRSSVAVKQNLIVGACVIDSGYDGEVFINLNNIGNETRIVKHGDKIAQLVVIPVECCILIECTEDEVGEGNKKISARGDKALGSSDGDQNE